MLTSFIYILIAAILLFVLYLAVKAITRGIEAKGENHLNEKVEIDNNVSNDSLTLELVKINKLYKDGVLTDEEFKIAKDKILNK